MFSFFDSRFGDGRPAGGRARWAPVLLWAAGVVGGFYLLWLYAGSAGPVGAPAGRWPAGAATPLAADRPTVLVFAHPRCPCTRAAVEQLARVTARHPGAAVRVLFWTPPDAPPDWAETDLWRTAAGIPGVTVGADPGGREARRYGARTSGHAVVYDPAGRLVFRGGLTGARGHAGDNPGADAVAAVLAGRPAPTAEAPVFGCPLFGPGECDEEGSACPK